MSFSGKKLLKSLKLLLLILGCSFFISLLLALIHIILTINITSAILGLTLLISSVITYFWNQNIEKNKYRLKPTKQVEVIANNQSIVEDTTETTVSTTVHRTVNTNSSSYIDTEGGNYNQEIGRDYIQGDYIGRDSVNKNIKNITIGKREVEINPNDIVETFDKLRDILTQSITQSSNALEAISEFAKELTEELRNHPEVKVCFGVNENISIQELVNQIFIDLLTKSYDQINESNQISRIDKPDQIQKINIAKGSEFIEHFESRGNNEYDILYKEYTIHLFQEKLKRWLYRIKRSDSSIFVEHSKHSRNIYFAIGRAIDQIDNEIDMNWKNSINNVE